MKNSIFKSIVSVILTVSMLFSFSALFNVNAAETKTGVINDTVRLRTGPGTNHEQVVNKSGTKIALYENDVVTILSEHNSSNNDVDNPIWYKVTIKKGSTTYTGYVSATYVIVNTNSGALENIPEEYKSYIEALLATHPDWNFVVYDTGIEWDSLFSTNAQCALGTNVVHSSYPLSYRSTQSGAYNWRADVWYSPDNETGWYQANTQLIAYYMDPRNFINEQHIFMFEALSYDEKTQTLDGVKKILSGSFMDNVEIPNSTGESILYAQAYINAGQIADVSPYHLASRTVQEVGKNGSGSTSGTYKAKDGTNYSGFYNFYNIGATASSDPIGNGLKYATGTTSSATQINRYLLPWNSQYKAIVGGAKWIGYGYINNKQDTLYYQKFNVVNKVWTHQYMANVMAPASESVTIKNAYSNLGILDNSFTFIIPYYRNMPAEVCAPPIKSNASPNNWLSSLKIGNYDINFDAGKTSGYSLEVGGAVSSVNVSATTVNSKAKVEGVGTVLLKEGNNEINIVVTAENGDKRTYTINIVRNIENKIPLKSISLDKTDISMFNSDSTTLKVSFNPSTTTDDTTVKWTSSNTKVATVSSAGKITAVGEGTATITAKVGNFTATCKVTVSNKILKGDVDADGEVTIADALMIFKHKSSEITLSKTAQKAADTDGNGYVELADALRIFKFKSGEIDKL
ncbi:MAG: Ig-like domain-containing protein [Clostridia bacterium]|nr:Ig-like domain-containing protein [Clostridia bacterium]